jgi:multidrug transporter EmrE-like cation transporter
VDITVVLVVLRAGLLHAVWNAMTKSLHDQYASFALLNIAIAITSFIMMAFVGLPRGVSGLSLRLDDLPPGLRTVPDGGVSPRRLFPVLHDRAGHRALAGVVGGFVFANEHLGPRGLLGIVVVVVGIVSLVLRRGAR